MHHLPFAFGLPHGSEWLYILIGIIILFGADKLPKLARGLGKSMGEFKKAKEDFEREVHAAADADTKVGDKAAPHISGNLPGPVTPTTGNTATSVDELTKKS
jgi:sec-independent protein translocase protein TatA